MTIDEQIEVMQHFKDGGKIECKMIGIDNHEWKIVIKPEWNFCDYNYRIAKTMYEISYDDYTYNIIWPSYVENEVNANSIGSVPSSTPDLVKAGRYRLDANTAKRDLDTQLQMMKLGALIESVALDLNDNWVADWNDNSQSKCCLFFDYTSNKYIIDNWQNFKTIGATYMSEQVANKVCEILNNGEYIL